MTHFALNAIPNDAVVHMICDVLSVEEESAAPLALIFSSWSRGNAFLLWKCFIILHYKNLLRTDPNSGQFVWDNDKIDIEMHAIKDMMTYKIGLLQEGSRESIKIAACLGSKLNEDILVHSRAKKRQLQHSLTILHHTTLSCTTIIVELGALLMITFKKRYTKPYRVAKDTCITTGLAVSCGENSRWMS